MTDKENPATRPPLSRERILEAAAALADRHGLGALTMRRLGSDLGVEAMSLYKHVANKDDILDGLVDLVVGEIELPEPTSDWKPAMRARAVSARAVLLRHPWAIGLFESRGVVGPTVLRYVDAVLASLRGGGFSVEAAARAFSLLDSFVYGHVVQQIAWSVDVEREGGATGDSIADLTEGDPYPHLREVAALQAATAVFDHDTDFDFGLDLILDALEERVRAAR